VRSLLVVSAVTMGLCATSAMADHSKTHKFHADHKIAAVEEPPPPTPTPTPEPPPPAPVTPPPPAPACVEKKCDSGFYIGGGAGSFMIDVTGFNVNGAGSNIRLKGSKFGAYGDVGYDFNRNIAVEFRAGGLKTDSMVQEGAPILGVGGSVPFTFIVDSDAFYSAFLKGTIPLGERFGIYGLVGGTHYVVNLAADIGPIPLSYRADYNDTDISYGGGIEARLGHSVKLGAEYVRYVDNRDGAVAAQLDGAVGRVQWKF
jgi:opacity protein-like surface antigen